MNKINCFDKWRDKNRNPKQSKIWMYNMHWSSSLVLIYKPNCNQSNNIMKIDVCHNLKMKIIFVSCINTRHTWTTTTTKGSHQWKRCYIGRVCEKRNLTKFHVIHDSSLIHAWHGNVTSKSCNWHVATFEPESFTVLSLGSVKEIFIMSNQKLENIGLKQTGTMWLLFSY